MTHECKPALAATLNSITKFDTYVYDNMSTGFPVRYLPADLDLSCSKYEEWLSERKMHDATKLYDVKVTLRQIFDRVLCGKDVYSEISCLANSFKRAQDFVVDTFDINTVLRVILTKGGFSVVAFKFVYNPSYVALMLENIREPATEFNKCIQTMTIVTNSLKDVENIRQGKCGSVRHMLIGTDTIVLLKQIEYNSLSHKYIIVCDVVVNMEGAFDSRHTHIKCICPYYIITIECRYLKEMNDISSDPAKKTKLVQGLLYPELRLPNDELAFFNVDVKMDVTRSARKIMNIGSREVMLHGPGTKISLRTDPLVVYLVEGFLLVTIRGSAHTVIELSTTNSSKLEKIRDHNKKNAHKLATAMCAAMNFDHIYIPSYTNFAVHIDIGDRVLMMDFEKSAFSGKYGTVKGMFHPELGLDYILQDHFHHLTYMVEICMAVDLSTVVTHNRKKSASHNSKFGLAYPISYVQCHIFDISQV
jgi:hypothetical protein